VAGAADASFVCPFSSDRFQVLETGGVMVGDRVDIEAEIEAVKQVEAQVA